jgi:hypothetical protein
MQTLRASPASPLRTAEVRWLLPLDRLRPGPYLLTFEATTGAVVLRRDVRFTVQ